MKRINRAFTLVELMAVIVIISLLIILTFPNIVNQIKKSKKVNKDNINSVVIAATKKYLSDNPNEFDYGTYCLAVEDLVNEDYLKEDIVKDLNDNVIKITNKKKFKYEIVNKDNCERCNADYCDGEGNGYTEVEYLKSTGTQYIDTGILATNAKIELSFKFNEIKTSSQVLINCRKTTAGWFGLSSTGAINLSENSFDIIYNDKHDFIIEYKSGVIKATDENGNIQQYSATPNINFTIFDEGASRRFPTYVNLYYTKIYDNDTLVRDYIPVLNSSNRPCLFDRVSKTCFYNKGTGEFLYG